jgi:hypothetical protein
MAPRKTTGSVKANFPEMRKVDFPKDKNLVELVLIALFTGLPTICSQTGFSFLTAVLNTLLLHA